MKLTTCPANSLVGLLQQTKAALHSTSTEALMSLLASLSAKLLHLPADSPLWAQVLHVAKATLTATAAAPLEVAKFLLLELMEIASFFPSEAVNAEISSALGEVYLKENNLQSALLCFQRATTSHPGIALQAFCHLGEISIRLRKYKQAVRYSTQALILAENWMKSVFPDTSEFASAKLLLQSIYTSLAECEDALNRPFQSKYWLRKSLAAADLPEPEDRRHCCSPELAVEKPEMMLLPSVSLESIEHWQPKPLFSKSESQFSYQDEEHCWSFDNSFDANGKPSHSRDSLQPEDLIALLTPESRHSSRTHTQSPQKIPDSESRRHVSLKIKSRKQTSEEGASILHQSWRRLSTNVFARIRLCASEEDWILSAHAPGSVPLEKEHRIAKTHPWRQMSPRKLVSHVDMGPDGEFFLPSEPQKTTARQVRLFMERKQFEGQDYSIGYSTDESMSEVKITARTKGKTICKIVYNDIALKSPGEVLSYVREVLAPQVLIEGDKIKVKTAIAPAKQGNQDNLEVIYSATSSSFPYPITISRPLVPYLNWKIVAQTPQKQEIQICDREVIELTNITDPSACATALANLLLLESEGRIGFKSRKFKSGVSVNVIDLGDVGQSEYCRVPFIPLSRIPNVPDSDCERATRIIQSFVRRRQAQQRLALLRKRVAVRLRVTVRQGADFAVFTVSQRDPESLKVERWNAATKSREEASPSALDLSSRSLLRDLALLFAPQLVLVRPQVIKGKRYLLSVYTTNGKVEIRAKRILH